jgi:hypothetical protein
MILLTHHTGEPHGILGAQLAATFLTRNLDMPSLVVGVERQFSKENLLKFLDDHYQGKERVIGFSHLCGRKDLLELIGSVKERGFFTLLGGPQAEADYYGEPGSETNPMRVQGLRRVIDLAVQGPVDFVQREPLRTGKGCFSFPWGRDIALQVDWENMYTFSDELGKLDVKTAQVLNAIGCPHAKKKSLVRLPPPETLKEMTADTDVGCYGCTFCDVSRDKAYHGHIDPDAVLAQIANLPGEGGRKIPFELIDEYPLASLKTILDKACGAGIELSRIDLVCRADDINTHQGFLRDALKIAREHEIKILFSSIGFESFNDRILQFFNKGIKVRDIVACVNILRELKDQFGDYLLYRTDEGARHGFIHPTPWDDSETIAENNMNIALYRFFEDILPPHSVPLIIHHSSCLGDWIRQLESQLPVTFKRDGTWIEWWSKPAGLV